MSNLVYIDTETYPIAEGEICPKVVCLQVAIDDSDVMIATGADGNLQSTWGAVLDALTPAGSRIIGHNLAFDLGVMARAFPETIPELLLLGERGAFSDTRIREKLLHLADHGNLDFNPRTGERSSFSLAALAKSNLGIHVEKDDTWRLDYWRLDGKPLADWPADAIEYAQNDVSVTRSLWDKQRDSGSYLTKTLGLKQSLFATEGMHAFTDFHLLKMTERGVTVDHEMRRQMLVKFSEEIADDKMDLLFSTGILIPGQPERPYANGAKHPDGTPKMKAAVPTKMSKKALESYVEMIAKERPKEIELRRTAKGNIQVDKEWLGDFAHLDPVLEQFAHRQKINKLLTTYLPAMLREDGSEAEKIYPAFDILKSTGRTSSYSHGLVPSTNLQNIDPRVRECFVPASGFVLGSFDFKAMELCTLAQTCLDLFGKSVLAEKIQAGVDTHEYLGAQICAASEPEFADAVGSSDPEKIYEIFHLLKGHKEFAPVWKKYRTLAKPTGLGYPGGLGPATMCKVAKVMYKVAIEEDKARELRDIWFATYPEMRQYLDHVNSDLKDDRNIKAYEDEETGEEVETGAFAYMSPFGMFRSGCGYCAAANGLGLQTPSAEGAKLAIIAVGNAVLDKNDLLHGCYPIAFVHDELLIEIPEDDKTTERCNRISELMCKAFRYVTSDIPAEAEPAIMRRWNKAAEYREDAQGRIICWDDPA